MIQLLIISLLILISTASASSVDKVVFTWKDDNGVMQSITDYSAPWVLTGANEGGAEVPSAYLTTPGKKMITADAFSGDTIVKSKVLEFEIVDSSKGRCDNLIANWDMSSGYEGFWRARRFGVLADVNEVMGMPATAILYKRRILRRGGPYYSSATNMDYSCLTPGSSWEVSTSVALMGRDGDGVSCTLGLDCPMVALTIIDKSGNIIFQIESRDYVETDWENDSWNVLKKSFTLPSADRWDGTVSSVNIRIIGYSGTPDLAVDNFSIVPV